MPDDPYKDDREAAEEFGNKLGDAADAIGDAFKALDGKSPSEQERQEQDSPDVNVKVNVEVTDES